MAPLPTFRPAAPIPPKPTKASNLRLTQADLTSRANRSTALGYTKQKWIEFCEVALRRGLDAYLYEARHTASKYITLRNADGKTFKVRFSNHKPIPSREAGDDCDFFVGVTNKTVTTTGDALRAVTTYFALES